MRATDHGDSQAVIRLASPLSHMVLSVPGPVHRRLFQRGAPERKAACLKVGEVPLLFRASQGGQTNREYNG